MKKFVILILLLLSVLFVFSFSSCNDKEGTRVINVILHNEDGSVFKDICVPVNKLASVNSFSISKDWYSFEGWFCDEELTTKFVPSLNVDDVVNLYPRLSEISYSVQVDLSIYGSAKLTGGSAFQTISKDNPTFEKISIEPNFGYRFSHYEINGIKYDESCIDLKDISSDVEILACLDYATDELPIVSIDTDNKAISSKSSYTDMLFSITNTEQSFKNVRGGIALRGNTTADMQKKPFKIKFDYDVGLFGLDESKSWVLLAEYIDPSAIHNYTAFELASESDGLDYTPTAHKVNVYLNGNYIGLYTLCEKINASRVGIKTEISDQMVELSDYNFLISMDASGIWDVDAVENETFFYVSKYDRYFDLKYPKKADFPSEAQFRSFFDQLVVYVSDLMDTFNEKNVTKIKELVDVNSLVDYMIIDQIMGEHDHFSKSFNMHFISDENGGKLYFGPIWDYDWCANVPWSGGPNEYYTINDEMFFSNIFFQAVAYNDELLSIAKSRYFSILLPALNNYISSYDSLISSMKESLELNQKRWYLSKPTITDDNIKFFLDFLKFRKNQLCEAWKIE